MASTERPLGRDEPDRLEILHESAHTRVSRLYFADRTVIRKEPIGPDALRRHRQELGILERLRGLEGVAQLVGGPRSDRAILLADAGPANLAEAGSPLAVAGLIGLAVDMTRAVAGMHRRGVLHRDISPANVVLGTDGTPCLVDFTLATTWGEIRPAFTHHAQIVGTLAYLAPEATGRTGRPVDQRADLYALGATLYELATGAPPFGVGDPLRLVHDHMARVPVPPEEFNPAVPAQLSAIVLHLLEKEPDNRYQTADGLLHDLERLQAAPAGRPAGPGRLGERDLPPGLLSPSRLAGRDAEVTTLQAAFDGAVAGRCRGVLVSGAPGVGKTALVDRLRQVVTGADGWFVTGKFDQYRRDLEFDGVYQAFRALGRLLLAEPEDELSEVRERILRASGPNAGLAAAVLPEFAALLGVSPDPGDPLTAQLRAQRNSVEVLRAVASPARPVVFFVDDLQWAGRTPLGVFDLVLSEEPIPGLLLVGAYREDDADATHPLAPTLSRWRHQDSVAHLRLANLPLPSSVTMVAEMLRVDPATAEDLARVIAPHTSGNPFETVELLDALRRAGLLTATSDGWRWDDAAVRTHLGGAEAAALSAARVGALPPRSRVVVEAMACLGGRTELSLLQTATGVPDADVEEALAPALEDGLLIAEPGVQEAVRFRHDRLRNAILAGMGPSRRRALHLAMARRIAAVPELFAVAAEQYLPVADEVDDAGERRQVVGLLRRAADEAALIGNYGLVNTLLEAALPLINPEDIVRLAEVHSGRHAALFSMGRLEEADEQYRSIERLGITGLERAAATCVQVRSLTYRGLLPDAIELGLGALRELGIDVPTVERLPAELDHQFGHLYRWLDSDEALDLTRPELADPPLLAAAELISATLPTAFFAADLPTSAWLSWETLRIWFERGPSRALLGPASRGAWAAVTMRADHAAGYRAVRRIVALGEARGYEPETSHARFLFAVLSCWFEPVEHGVDALHRAREGLIAGGDLANAGYTYHPTVPDLLDCAPSLDVCVAEIDAGLAFLRRTGNEQSGQANDSHRWLVGLLRGEGSAAGGPNATDRYADNPPALLHAHITRAIAAAIFGDPAGLDRHTAAAMPMLLTAMAGMYMSAVGRVLRGLALAWQAQATADADERGRLLSELDELTRWLAARATDAPENFLHLLRLLEAERAWVLRDFRAAAIAFDAARHALSDRRRPWHGALIAERAGRLYLTHHLEEPGHDLLDRARDQYAAWGATAKVAQLDWAYPSLRPAAEAADAPGTRRSSQATHRRATVTTGTIDLLGILSGSQALSSETSIDRLHARVVEVLGAMTGATGVHLLTWSDDRQDWLLPTPTGTVPVRTGHETAAPLSVLRYVRRTREPLVVADATVDDRFARDPYFADAYCCSLLAVPIFSRDTLRAVLLLENRLLRGAFTADRLDAVRLIAGQLAVSLDNAHLYAELAASRARIVAAGDASRQRIERDLHDGAQQRLVSLALRVQGMVRATVPLEAGELTEQLDDVAAELRGVLEELRELARGLHPPALAAGGLRSALRTLARRSAVPVRLDVRVDRRLPEGTELAAYFSVAEALTNAAKHAQATVVDVDVESIDGVLRIRVHDDGRGGVDLSRGSGLVGLKDRAEALGGWITVHSPTGAGTTLTWELPLHRRDLPAGAALDDR